MWLLFHSEAYEPFDPYGNITIKWDVIAWNDGDEGYVVSIYSFTLQKCYSY
jgi:hypothetical protein